MMVSTSALLFDRVDGSLQCALLVDEDDVLVFSALARVTEGAHTSSGTALASSAPGGSGVPEQAAAAGLAIATRPSTVTPITPSMSSLSRISTLLFLALDLRESLAQSQAHDVEGESELTDLVADPRGDRGREVAGGDRLCARSTRLSRRAMKYEAK